MKGGSIVDSSSFAGRSGSVATSTRLDEMNLGPQDQLGRGVRSVLDHADVEEFRAAWRETYGEDLAFDRAEFLAEQFVEGVREIALIAKRVDERRARAN